jgi:hypothetical protein
MPNDELLARVATNPCACGHEFSIHSTTPPPIRGRYWCCACKARCRCDWRREVAEFEARRAS